MRSIVLALALCTAAAPAIAAPAKKDAPVPAENIALGEATRIVDAFHAALKKGDRAAAKNLLDDQVEIFEQGFVEKSKDEYVAHHLDADIEYSAKTQLTRTSYNGAMLGNLAYFTSQNTITGTYKGKAVNSVSIETMILHKAPSGWKILHIHWSSRESAVEAPKPTRGTQP